MTHEVSATNLNGHWDLGPLQAAVKVHSIVYYAVWFGAVVLTCFWALGVVVAISQMGLEGFALALGILLLPAPFWLFGRWMRMGEIECYEEGVILYTLLGREVLRFGDMASFFVTVRRKERYDETLNRTVYHEVPFLHFVICQPTQREVTYHPRLHEQGLAKVIEYCSQRMATSKRADENLHPFD